MGYIDMGMDTDMEEMRRVFPEARRACLYSPVKVEQLSLEEIEQDLRKIAGELGPCDLVLADMETNIPDERIRAVLEIAEKISSEM